MVYMCGLVATEISGFSFFNRFIDTKLRRSFLGGKKAFYTYLKMPISNEEILKSNPTGKEVLPPYPPNFSRLVSDEYASWLQKCLAENSRERFDNPKVALDKLLNIEKWEL